MPPEDHLEDVQHEQSMTEQAEDALREQLALPPESQDLDLIRRLRNYLNKEAANAAGEA